MSERALNEKDVGKNIKVDFLSKENTENAIYGIEIFLQTLLENSISGY